MVTLAVDLLPLTVVANITAVPADLAVTTPELLTEATEELEDVQVTVLFVALEGVTVAVRVAVSPTARLRVLGVTVTPVGRISLAATVTLQVAVFPLLVVAVMTALPAATATTLPSLSTVATLSALELQVTVLFVALEGVTVAVRVADSPTVRSREVGETVTPVGATVWVKSIVIAAKVPGRKFFPEGTSMVLLTDPARPLRVIERLLPLTLAGRQPIKHIPDVERTDAFTELEVVTGVIVPSVKL